MLKKIPYVQGLVWTVIFFVLPLPLIQALATGLPSIYQNEALAVQAGSIAYVWFLASIYLTTRPKWLDRLIGLPSIYMIHGMLSLLAILLAFLHKSGTQSAGWIKLTGDWAFDLFLGLMIYSLVFMAGWLTSRIKLLAWIKHTLERLFKHEFSVWLHRLNLVAVVLVFIHVQLISYITSITAYIWLFNLYSAVVLVTYLFSKFKNARLLPGGRVVTMRELAPNFYEFTIQMRHPNALHVEPGDYLFIKFPDKDGLKELHPFSVVNNVQDDGCIVLAIRGDGDFTRLVQRISKGTRIQIDGSYGRFTTLIHDHPQDELVLIGGGSGVVPLIAIIEAHPEQTITLFYSAHRRAELIYHEHLIELASRRSNLTVHIQQGRFDPATMIKNTVIRPATLYLMSGPASLGHAWQHALAQAGVGSTQRYYEEFSW